MKAARGQLLRIGDRAKGRNGESRNGEVTHSPILPFFKDYKNR